MGRKPFPPTPAYLTRSQPLQREIRPPGRWEEKSFVRAAEKLFALTTKGGHEYCGMVIDEATQGLGWSPDSGGYKAIFIAGNEPFTQGSVDFRKVCPAAIARGIIVNTIFCGNEQEGIQTHWKDGADLADGRYMSIDHNTKVVHIEAPQDVRIAELNMALNDTYIPYGTLGKEGRMRQAAQDANALSLAAEVVVQRTASKASAQYTNTSWDLVDAVKEGKLDLASLKEEELPAEMQKMSADERSAHVEKMTAERKKIQDEIQHLSAERVKYVTEQSKKLAGSSNTLDEAILKAVREQAGRNNFTFRNADGA